MSARRDASTPIEQTFRTFLTDKGKGDGGADGAYRRDAQRELDRFLRWCRGRTPDPANASPPESWEGIVRDEDRDVRFSDLDSTVFGDYARYLVVSGFSNGTVLTYYAYIASWCGWADAQGYIPRHYARESDAEDPLPEDKGRRPGDQQAWSPEQRDELTRYVDDRASAAIDEFGAIDVPATERDDRALAYVLCYTGLRASEFLNAPDDDRPGRNGVRWSDLSFSDNNVTVYRKKQQWDEASLPDPVLGPLKRYRQLLDAPEDWPVFTTLHRPTLARHVTAGLREQGLEEGEIERVRDAKPDLLVAAEFDLDAPPALKPNGARRVLQRLCADAGIAVDDDRHDYLAPHGGRRGMGEVMVREFGYAAAARYLDNSEEQVRQAYQHIEAAERADMATEALSKTDGRVRESSPSDLS